MKTQKDSVKMCESQNIHDLYTLCAIMWLANIVAWVKSPITLSPNTNCQSDQKALYNI